MLRAGRRLIGVVAMAAPGFIAAPALAAEAAAPPLPEVELFAPTPCLACIDWAEHLRAHGFTVRVEQKTREQMARLKRWINVPSDVESRMTARVGGYFVEGHVPAEDIIELLKSRPLARGLAVPGMPRGAPGYDTTAPTCETGCTMLDRESGYSDVKRELYDTLLVKPDGATEVWARH
jgi:hypothetical protein